MSCSFNLSISSSPDSIDMHTVGFCYSTATDDQDGRKILNYNYKYSSYLNITSVNNRFDFFDFLNHTQPSGVGVPFIGRTEDDVPPTKSASIKSANTCKPLPFVDPSPKRLASAENDVPDQPTFNVQGNIS